MPEINTEVTPQPEVVSTNWDALEKDYSNTPLTQEKPAEQKTEPAVEEKTIVDEVAKLEETKTEPKVEEKKPDEVKDETKEEVVEEKPIIEFKVEEILPESAKLAEEGTWLRIAQDLKLEGVTEDSWEAFDKARTAPLLKEIETLKLGQKVDYLATLKPETATALKLIEMGVKEEALFAPTREIESYLSMTPEQLVRADFELQKDKGWTDELIDAKMEELAADPKKLQLADAELRIYLNEEKTRIINERSQLVQNFESQKEAAALQRKQAEDTQFEQTLNTVSKFMDVPVNEEVKKAIITKYRNGGYDNDFSSAKSKVDLILNKELGTQLIKSLKNTAFEKGRETVTKKLANIPIVTNTNVGSKVETNNQSNDNWAAIEKDFGIK
jgi:hypothetical protein